MKHLCRLMVIISILLICFEGSVSAEQYDYYLEGTHRVPIPKTYDVKNVIYDLGSEAGFLNQAEDLYIDKKGILYVADTGNNRIVKMTATGQVQGVFTGPKDKPLNKPTGIYVDPEGDMFVADTANSRITHLSPKGEYVEQFVKPDSELLGSDFSFTPNKVYVNSVGYVYLIKSQSFMSIDANNQFRGFIGATEVPFDFYRLMVRMFASAEQKKRIAKVLPASYSNFVIDDSEMIYAVTLNTSKDQIRKINSVGKNIFPSKFYGEMIPNSSNNKMELPYFVDIAVDKNGLVSVLEQKSGRIYQYDQNGNLLTAFGGLGKWKGVFDLPSSLAVDQDGTIYVLDRKLNNIQVFEPTRFIQLVSKAVTLFSEGKYEDSSSVWREVLQIDANYNLAHAGIGKVYMKEGKWKEAMNEYLMIDDKAGYSSAFGEYRHEILRKYFTLVVVISILLIVVLFMIIGRLKVIAYKAWQEGV